MTHAYNCAKGCCLIKISEYVIPRKNEIRRGNYSKAGVFLYDPKEDRVLLVQSRGQLWGPPKGSLEVEKNETSAECAIREVKEETGLVLNAKNFSRATKIKNRALYYYIEYDTCNVKIQEHENDECNDANGITWIKLSCLSDCIKSGSMVLNQHCRIGLKRFLNRNMPETEFVKV